MKKHLILFITIILVLINLDSCGSATYSKEKITNLLNAYFENNYGLIMKFKEENNDIYNSIDLESSLELNKYEGVNIQLRVFNSITSSINNNFYVNFYRKHCKEKDVYKNINIEKFCNIVNTISKRKISVEYVTAFLKSPKTIDKENSKDGDISRVLILDFFDNYVLGYDYYEGLKEENLWFDGLCK